MGRYHAGNSILDCGRSMRRDTDFVAAAPNACYGALAVWGLGLRRRFRARRRLALRSSPSDRAGFAAFGE